MAGKVNAVTVSPSPDTGDRKLYLSTTNPLSNFHQSIEPAFTTKTLQMIFESNILQTIKNWTFPPSGEKSSFKPFTV